MPKRPLPPIGFWSYARPDDELSGGQLSRLRSLIRAELQQQYGRGQIQLFQDISAISHGSRWEGEIRRALENSTFFIPILSPNFVQSEWCVQEVEIFKERQERLFDEHPDLPRTSRIFPIHFIDVTGVDGLKPEVDAALAELQWFDFRDLRHSDYGGADVRRTVSSFVTSVRDLLRVQVEQTDEVAAPPPVPPAVSTVKPVAVPIAAAATAPAPEPDYPPIPEPAAPVESGADRGGSKLPLLIGGGIVAVLVIAALVYFLVIRRSAEAPVAATNATSNVVADSAAVSPGEAEPTTFSDAEWTAMLVGRWGENPACTGRVWTLAEDGSYDDVQPGRWAVADGVATLTDSEGAFVATPSFSGATGEILNLTPVEGTAGEPETWYACPDQGETASPPSQP